MFSAKKRYRDYCKCKENYIPIFIKDWYLDAVCDSKWDVLEIIIQDKKIGFWPYMLKKKYGFSFIIPPKLCPFMGPVLFEKTEVDFDHLISQLPSHQLFIQDIFHNADNLFLDTGNKWTYVFEDIQSIEKINVSRSTKRNIRKATKFLNVKEISEFEIFFNLLDSFFKKQGKENPYDRDTFQKLDRVLHIHNSRKIIIAYNEDSKPVAVEYIIEDEKWVYNFANSYDNTYRHNGVSLLLWNAIKYTLENKKNFDFEGSMIPGVEQFFQSFGATKKPYLSITKTKNIIADIILKIKNPNIV